VETHAMLRCFAFAIMIARCSAFAPAFGLRSAAPIVLKAATPITPVALKTAVLRTATPAMLTGLEGPALINAAWVILAYNLMPLGPTANGLGMGGKSMNDAQKRWGDRAFGNMIEQAPMFLSSLWLHALFVSSTVATQLGAIYLALRLCYPIIWAVWGGAKGVPFNPYTWKVFGKFPVIYYSTFPQYGIVFYMAFATVLKLAFGLSLNALVMNPLIAAPVGFGIFLYHYAYVLFPALHEAIAGLFA